MNKQKLINYDRLNHLVLGFEQWRDSEGLDLDEEKLLMDILKERRETKLSKMKADDYISNMSGGIIGSLFKKTAKVIK